MFSNKQQVCFKVSHLAYKVRLMPLDQTSYKQMPTDPVEEKVQTPVQEPESPTVKDNPIDPLFPVTLGTPIDFRALPKLNLVRVFAFVQQRVFLQEPISTCFSFLLNWDPVPENSTSEDGSGNESECEFAAEMEGAPSLNQGAEVIPCAAMFRNLTRQLHLKNLICLCEVDTDFFGLIDCITLQDESNKKSCYLRLQVFQKHDKIPWQTDISTMLFTLIEQRSIKNSLFSIQKYMEILPTFNEPFASSQREAWANQLASALIQIRVQGKQSECRKKVLTALDIAQVLYDQQFVAYLKKTFLDDNGNNGTGNGTTGMAAESSSGRALPGSGIGASNNSAFLQDTSSISSDRSQFKPTQPQRNEPTPANNFKGTNNFTRQPQQFQQSNVSKQMSTGSQNFTSGNYNNSAQGAGSGKSSSQKFEKTNPSVVSKGGNYGGSGSGFQSKQQRPFYQNNTTNQNNNNDASSNYSVSSQQQNSASAGRASNTIKRKTYDGRQKGLESAAEVRPQTGANNAGANQAHKRFNK